MGTGTEAIRQELERVLKGAIFVRNERLSRFLRFVVERHLRGRAHEIKESVIAIEVFGRKPDYNPKHDPIVRTEATRLRARLSQYYMDEGRCDPLVIEQPKGGYLPVFRKSEVAPVRDLPCRPGDFGCFRRLPVSRWLWLP
jgi:hypothetical protein